MSELICQACSTVYSMNDPRWQCDCGGLLDISFVPAFPLEKIKQRKPLMWRYREAIPIENDAHIVSFDEGFTPLSEVVIAGKKVLIKQEHLFPTGSFKDRGASVLISKIKELGISKVVEDSSGNAGSAIAAYCAAAGIACDIYVPADTSEGKLAQIQLFGANLNKIPGTREDTAAAVLKAAETVYYASHYWNPFFFHGTKTFAFEVAEQLGWKSPDTLILAVGNGSLILGAYIGFKELYDAGIIDKIPRLIGVQTENCAPLYHAFRENLKKVPEIKGKKTIAEGIAIAAPIRGNQIIEAVRNTGGHFIVVSEDEIKESLKEMCRRGYYIEPTAAAAIAGVKKYLHHHQQGSGGDELIVLVFTGHGLKAGRKMLEF
ncbi:MAG: threonine synthase [Candidatus Aminicenantes bacterium]|nr:threonine synthase [Candidatus Aminicenantes bacterium]NIM77721.1 threonine synthase [Candidatus Aminicenantes bacterium]NIN17034.1 threonine synthase [Candidatus Aminicenantes bacterium]NIN40927.1 threonine synthase [Candidatus Aminicenantes bacterium]NIN83732.1 threonine synthase [Candidatus Aminicenantes bacterium]